MYYEEYVPCGLSVYEHLEQLGQDYLDRNAISFYGKKYLYKTFFEKIDEISNALWNLGVRKNDVVASSLPGCPEGIFLIYAINKIGARYCGFDCRSKKEEVRETLQTFSPKVCFVPDFQLKEFSDVFDYKIVFLSVINSLEGLTEAFGHFCDFFTGRTFLCSKHKNFMHYRDFEKVSNYFQVCEKSISDENIFGYFYTSGTSYGRKSIILTNENIIAAVKQQKASSPFIEVGDSILNIMPLFTCYSVTLAVHLPLISGVNVNLIPLVNTKKLKKILLKEKPNFIISVPAHWEYFIKEKFNNCDLSFLKVAIIGGDVVNPNFKDKIDKIFRMCGCQQPLSVGYGMSETTSTATTCLIPSPMGSVGKPLKNTLVDIVNRDTGEHLNAFEKGEICIYGPTICRGYVNDEMMTKALLQKHSDGKLWLHSGDIGYKDEEGTIYFCERIKRMYVRHDGTKISPYSIEQTLLGCSFIDKCMVVGIPDSSHSHGQCAKALIVLKEGRNTPKAKKEVWRFVRSNLDVHMVPEEINFVKKLPYTKNGKLDYFSAYR